MLLRDLLNADRLLKSTRGTGRLANFVSVRRLCSHFTTGFAFVETCFRVCGDNVVVQLEYRASSATVCYCTSRRCVVVVFSVVAIFAVSAALVVTFILVAVTRLCRSA